MKMDRPPGEHAAMYDLPPDRIAGLIDAIGGDSLAPRLLDAARALMPAVEIFAYAGRDGAPPRPLLSHGLDGQAQGRVRSFASHFHIADPLRDTRARTPRGGSFATRIATSQIGRGDYRWQCFERPGFAEKLCFGWRDGAEDYVLNFYLTAPAPADMAALNGFGSLCMGMLLRHAATEQGRARPLADRLADRMATRHPDLTERERAVAARLLAGRTAEQAAAELGISINSLATYRRRACARLGIASLSELLDDLL